MARVHQNVVQSAEVLYCDSTASLDRFNTPVFILSTSQASGGVPVGVIITSNEKEETIQAEMNLWKTVLPEKAFFGNGAEKGPAIVMTDDSSTEKNALKSVWPHATQLLCVCSISCREDGHGYGRQKTRSTTMIGVL